MRIRLILSFIFIVLLTTFTTIAIAGRRAANEVRTFVARGGVFGVERLADDLEAYYREHNGWQGVERVAQPPGPQRRVQLAQPDGTVILDTRGDPGGQLTPEQRAAAIPLRVDGRIVGYLLPAPGYTPPPNLDVVLLNRLTRVAWTAALLAILISIALALALAYTLLRPVRELTRAAAALAQGDLSQRVPVRGDDEIATLARTFNHMAASLQQAETQRKAMTADIAHELRTPLSVQRANLEALQDGVYPLTPENLTPVLEQTMRLERLVDDLRTLALADAGQLELVRTPTDLPALIRRVTDPFRTQAGDRQIIIEPPPTEACPPLDLDPGRVEQILGNLLSNALRHTPEGGTIRVQCSVVSNQWMNTHFPEFVARKLNTEHWTLITVRDSGPGIPEEALPHIFERFYRGDRSRSRAEGGTGLGLSIARKLAQAHGGDLLAANHPEGGAVFTLVLPV